MHRGDDLASRAGFSQSRSFGVPVDATFFGANPAAYDAVVAREFNLIVAGNVMSGARSTATRATRTGGRTPTRWSPSPRRTG
jgi:hypothetical protein